MAKFLITDTIYWDDEKKPSQQSKAAQEWLYQTRRKNADKVIKDSNSRPIQWIYETDKAILTIEHIYLYPNSTNWTLDKIIINVKKK